MGSTAQDAKRIFLDLAHKVSPDEWELRLETECQGNEALKRRVAALLQAHASPRSALEPAPVEVTAVSESEEPVELPDTQIGAYKLIELIGEGGMGSVYMAEQKEPVRRKVALKIIKPGMDSKQVVLRFEAERQALALMNHPNIAKVFDAGATESGRPFFVMELVKGVPITEFCTRRKLEMTERLRLFDQVCQAVQHAHQKGIIHRDLKPSNVLVELHNVTSVPKVIDFGVAKATHQQLTDNTLHTGFAQVIGTPLYMSPEQAELNALDIDTRSDVYSLGVLLYELITGTTPLSPETIKSASFDEVRRIIREDDPPRPSHRITTLNAEQISTLSDREQSDPQQLMRRVERELDWIVMKAIEKDRVRRYESASSLAADIQRYLKDEQVLACPPSSAYRLRKFARRNKAGLAIVALAAVALMLGIVGLAVGNALIAEERDNARQERQEADRQREVAEKNFRRARDAVDTYLTKVSEETLLDVPGLQTLRKDLLQLARDYYQQFIDEQSNDSQLRAELASAHTRIGNIEGLGDRAESLKSHQKALDIWQSLLELDPKDAVAQNAMAESYISLGRLQTSFAESITSLERAVQVAKPLVKPSHRATLARAYFRLGATKLDQFRDEGGIAKMEDAQAALERAVEILKQLETQHPESHQLKVLADTYAALGLWHETIENSKELMEINKKAQSYRQEALKISKTLAEGDEDNLEHSRDLARRYRGLGMYEEAIAIFKKLAEQNPAVVEFQRELGNCYLLLGYSRRQSGHLNESIAAYERSVQTFKELRSDYPDEGSFAGDLGGSYYWMAGSLERAWRLDEAADAFKSATSVVEQVEGFRGILADSYAGLSRVQEAVGDREAGIASLRRCLDINLALVTKNPDQLRFLNAAASRTWGLGDLQRQAGQHNDAFVSYQSAIELLSRKIDKGDVDGTITWTVAVRQRLVSQRSHLAIYLNILGRHKEAARLCRDAINKQVDYLAEQPESEMLRGNLGGNATQDIANLRAELVTALARSDQTKSVETFYHDELKRWRERADQCVDTAGCRVQLIDIHHQLGHWLEGAQQHDAAKTHFEKSHALSKTVRDDDRVTDLLVRCPIVLGQPSQSACSLVRELECYLTLARDAVKDQPSDGNAWMRWSRAAFAYYRPLNWEGADVEANVAVGLGSSPAHQAMLVRLFLLAGKQDKYRAYCEMLLDRWKEWNGRDLGQAAFSCMHYVHPPLDVDQLRRLVKRAVDEGPPWGIERTALIRLGDPEIAVRELSQFDPGVEPIGVLFHQLDLAIAHQMAGNHEEARTWLSKARTSARQLNAATHPYPHHSLEFEVKLKEAEHLIRTDSPP